MSIQMLAIVNSKVVTLDERDTIAEAIAIKDGRICAIGSNNEIEKMIKNTKNTIILDAKGNIALPGLIETHGHLIVNAEFERCVDAGSPPNKSIADIVANVTKHAKMITKGEWIVGKGYDPTRLSDKKLMDRFDLDKATTDHPVVIQPFSGPMAFANSEALNRAGITRETADPPGSEIMRIHGSGGEPNGILKGYNAMGMVFQLIPPVDWDGLKIGLNKAQEKYLNQGITSFHEPKLARFVLVNGHDALKIYQRGIREKFLKLRINMMIHYNTLKDLKFALETGLGNERIRVGGVSFIGDGAHIYLNAAAVSEPYLNKPTEKGYLAESLQNNDLTAEMQRQGYQILIHAMGDRGIGKAIDVLENAQKQYPRQNTRHRIEHASMAQPEHLLRMRNMGIMPNFSVQQIDLFGDRFLDTFLGPERAHKLIPISTALSLGIKPLMHSEAGTPSPLMCVQCAVSRKTSSGYILGEDEKISIKDALKMVTINAAYASFEENMKGTLEINKLGDVTILEQDPFLVLPENIGKIPVATTIIGGEIAYLTNSISLS